MTTPPALPPPPFGDDTDAAISARLDGELAGFAADHGTTEAEVVAALDAWAGTAARTDALSRARDAAATPVAPLDDLARRRLVQGALAARAEPARPSTTGGRDRRGTWLTAAAAVVAILVVVAVGAMVLSNDDSSTDQANTGAGGSASVAESAPTGNVGDVGDVTDPDTLRALLQGTEAKTEADSGGGGEAVPPAAGSAADDGGQDLDAQNSRRTQGGDPSALSRAPSDPDACAGQLAGSRPIRFVGTGTYQGRPVVVVGLDSGGRTIAFVVPLDDCTTVLSSVSR